MGYIKKHLSEAREIIDNIDSNQIEEMVDIISNVRNQNGRLFFLGVGGSSANASHAVNDFRKICNIECYAPSDNVSELTARTNDDGWENIFIEWLKVSKLSSKDCICIFSVGGGDEKNNISVNLIHAINYAKKVGSKIIGIVGKSEGFTVKMSDSCCIVPIVSEVNITPHSESFQAVVWHAIVSHPKLKKEKTKWETVK